MPSALWENIAELIRAAILSGELEPGSKLIETELAERFGTSRGPIREAIRELAREGLVTELPRRGTLVSTLTAHDLSEVYAVRQALELAASSVVIARARDDELHALEVHLVALESPPPDAGLSRPGRARPRLPPRAGGAGSQRAHGDHVRADAHPDDAAAAHRGDSRTPRCAPTCGAPAHRDILQALLDRDEAKARAAIEAHYRYAEERLFPGVTVRG